MALADFPLDTKISIEGTRLYRPLRNLCLLFDAIAFGILAAEGIKPRFRADSFNNMTGHIGGLSVQLPSEAVFAAALREQAEPPIWARLTKNYVHPSSPPPGTLQRSGKIFRLVDFVNESTALQFVMFYEDHINWVKSKASFDIRRLEPTWAFGRVVRNAIGHAGKISMNDKSFPPVSWEGLTYGPKDDGKQILGPDLHAPDFILLMLDMDRALEEMGYAA